ncbi:MAG: hypothetical protein AAGJ81_07825 [Verrucomicrobiota bacterium]
MKLFRQALVAFLANGLVLFIILELNSFIASYSLYITVGGIFVVYPALRMPLNTGFPVVLLTGALWDAITPAPFGLYLFVLGFLYAGLYLQRNRFRSRRTFHLAVVSLGTNFILLLVVSVWFLPSAAFFSYASRCAIELLLSEAVVVLLAYWIFDLQEVSVSLVGAQPTPEELS